MNAAIILDLIALVGVLMAVAGIWGLVSLFRGGSK